MLYPLTFKPIFKERVWGGSKLAELYDKTLPGQRPIGESWEISDRPGDVSVIANGPLAGKDLHWLVEHYPAELLGSAKLVHNRFPLLIKILDAEQKLSLQVHPPADKAVQLGGEPKTEMWYVADAAPDAELYVGLKRGVTRQEFERKTHDGTVADCFHRIQVRAGDAMFLPSGRVHAIGAGLVIFEVQQNSDTTYRVFDWNRAGTDGKPRALHIRESLASINFDDFEPGLASAESHRVNSFEVRTLVADPLFQVRLFSSEKGGSLTLNSSGFQIIGMIEGRLEVGGDKNTIDLRPGAFCLVPARASHAPVQAQPSTSFLLVSSEG